MKQIKHVRFTLSELQVAITEYSEKEALVSEVTALNIYWALITGRGWRLVSAGAIWSDQGEVWNVIWSGSDTSGPCDLPDRESMPKPGGDPHYHVFWRVVNALGLRGWVEIGDAMQKARYDSIAFAEIRNKCNSPGVGQNITYICDVLERAHSIPEDFCGG